MAQIKNLIARWDAAWPSPMIISRQYDNCQFRIDLMNYPEPEYIVDEQTEQMEILSYYLIVWMKETEDGEYREMSPIMLPGPYWIVPNYYTQLVQDIRFQFCVQSDSTDYEAHSAIFTGRIVDSIEHDGTAIDVIPVEMFDAYKAYIQEIAMAAGAVVIDPNLDTAGAAADAKAAGDAIKAVQPFVVQVPGSAAVYSGSITSGDFARALAAYTAGSGVYAVKDSEIYQLSAAGSSTMTFTQMYHGTMNFIKQIQITSADTFAVTNTSLSSSAADTSYSNTASGLTATNVQDAIDESAAALSNTNERLEQLQSTVYKTVPSTEVITWEQGNLKPNDGTRNSSTARIRTTDFLPSNISKIAVNDDNYRLNIYGYNESDNSYAGMWMGTEFKPYSSSYTIKYSEFAMSNAEGYKVKIVVLRADGTAITPTDAEYVDCDIPLVNMDEINGEFENTNASIDELKAEVLKTVTSEDVLDWQQGNIKANDGTTNDSTVRIRTRVYIPSNIRKLTVTNAGYRMWICGYSALDDSYLGLWNGTDFVAYSSSGSYGFSGFDMSDADGNFIKIVLLKSDGTEVTVSDAVYVSCILPVVDVDAITSDIEEIESNIYSEVESPELMLWSQGNFNADTGGEASSTIAIRTGYVDKSVLSVRLADTDHKLSIFAYNSGTYVGMWTGIRFGTNVSSAYRFHESFDMKDAGEYDIRFRIVRADGENCLPSEGDSLMAKVMAFTVDNSTPTEYTGKEISVFDNILCIGDSLIAGGGNRPAGIEADQSKASRTVVGAMYSIPTQLSKMYGIDTTNWGISGATTESWYNHYSSDSWSGHDAALLYIGSNDYNYVTTQGLTIEEGAEKSYTYLKNIISKLKTDNVGIRIFLCTLNPGSTKGTYAQYRIPLIAKMRQIANEEPSVFLIDMNTYGTLETYSPYHNGHPTPIGYNLMAREMGSYISWTINNKPQSFKWIRWIGTEYAVGENDTPTGDLPDVG